MHFFMPYSGAAQCLGLWLPLGITLYLAYSKRAIGFDGLLCLIFLASTALDIALAHFTVTPDLISLTSEPICSLSLIFMGLFPGIKRPSAALGYNMVFYSEFLRDLLCGTHYALAHNTPHFLSGVGGAGLADGLFIQPLLTALSLYGLTKLPAFERRFITRASRI